MLTNARHPEMPYSQIGQVTNFALKLSENSESALNVASQGTEMALFGPFRPHHIGPISDSFFTAF
jgi:hypothetical protein